MCTFCRLEDRYSEWRLLSICAVGKLSIRMSSMVKISIYFVSLSCDCLTAVNNSRYLWDRLFFFCSYKYFLSVNYLRLCVCIYIYISLHIHRSVCVCKKLYVFFWDKWSSIIWKISFSCNNGNIQKEKLVLRNKYCFSYYELSSKNKHKHPKLKLLWVNWNEDRTKWPQFWYAIFSFLIP